jgi:predicted membrane-bound mannosyltransferase
MSSPAPAAWSMERITAMRIPLTIEVVLYALVVVLAVAFRFWDLGGNALHHDESIHAQWSWDLTRGQYTHNPVFHGPLYYHAQAFVNLLFGTSDYTSRMSAALFGVALVLLPLLVRKRLGPVGTFAAVAFIAFSPTIVYYSRFMREDIYMAAFTMLMAVAMWRYIDEGRDRWLIVFALALAGSFATKEATFLTVAIFLLFTNALIAAGLARQTMADRGHDGRWRHAVFSVGLMPYAWAIAALWPFLGGFRKSMAWHSLPRAGDVLVILGTLTVPLLTPLLKSPLETLGVASAGQLGWPGVCDSLATDATQNRLILGGVFTMVVAAVAFVGLQWRPRTWAIAAGSAALLYLTLMTTVWTNFGGLCSGPWGSLDYWLGQQEAYRGNQPWFYYHMLMPAYEFLPLIIAVGGLWWSVVRGNSFSRFLVFWAVGTWLVLSWAGEKMPWLNTHIALPVILLAAWTVQRAWDAWRPQLDQRSVLSLAGIAAIAAGSMLFATFAPGGTAMVLLRWAALVGAAVFIAVIARPWGRSAVPAVLVVAVVGALGFFSVRTTVMSAFVHGDTPRSMLVYTQSSPDIPDIRDDINRLAAATGLGYNLRIAVDSSDAFSWPWAWYLRDYRSVTFTDFANAVPQGEFDVMLVSERNTRAVNDYLAGLGEPRYQAPQRYPHRWWFDERYKQAMSVVEGQACTASGGDCGPFHHWVNIGHGLHLGPPRVDTFRRIVEGFTDDGWPKTWFAFFRDREPARPPGAIYAVAYFRIDFDRETGYLSARALEAPAPGVDESGRPTFGGLGVGDGQFFAPVDIAADSQGNLYVIDRTTRKLQKFDADGNFIASVDVRETADGPLPSSEPWGLAVGPDDQIIVADTFGWRVRVFDSDLQATGVMFGVPPTGDDPGPYDLFGPRDAVVDANGLLWVTDTGHDRIQIYTLQGEFVRTVGESGPGPGQLDEPVGLSIADEGTIFVADMLNSRVSMFDSDGNPAGSFPVAGWGGEDVNDKPYLTALSDGRIALSLPLFNEVRIYNRDGTLEATITDSVEPIDRPYGIVEGPDGRIWVVEGGSGRVRLFDIP